MSSKESDGQNYNIGIIELEKIYPAKSQGKPHSTYVVYGDSLESIEEGIAIIKSNGINIRKRNSSDKITPLSKLSTEMKEFEDELQEITKDDYPMAVSMVGSVDIFNLNGKDIKLMSKN